MGVGEGDRRRERLSTYRNFGIHSVGMSHNPGQENTGRDGSYSRVEYWKGWVVLPGRVLTGTGHNCRSYQYGQGWVIT